MKIPKEYKYAFVTTLGYTTIISFLKMALTFGGKTDIVKVHIFGFRYLIYPKDFNFYIN